MALVDPNIALSYRGIQLQDPLEQYSKASAAQLNALQMDKFMRDRDALKQIQAAITSKGGPPDLEAAANEMIRSGIPEYMQQGIAIRQKVQETKAWENYEKRFLSPKTQPTAETTAAPTTPSASVSPGPFQTNMLENRQNLPLNRLMPSVEAPAAPAPKVSEAPVAVSKQQRIIDLEEEINMLSAIDTPKAKARQQVLLKQLDAALKPESNRPLALSPGQRLYSPTGEVLATAPDKPQQPRNPIAVIKDGKPVLVDPASAIGQTPLTPPAVQILGMGPGREAPAPTVTTIQDPTNPNQMITIDARQYRGGGVGSTGVLGLAGKTPAATAAATKREEGQQQAGDILDTLETAYADLDRMKAVPSQQRSAMSNVLSYVAGTGVGQVAGRVVGSEAQTQRDIIQSSRNQLLNAVKNATGMSAQQLNSNVEFRSWLEALSDPTRSIEANKAILGNMRRFIANNTKKDETPASTGARPSPAPKGAKEDPLGIR